MSDVEAYNPYAPPTAHVAAPATASGLKRRSVLVAIVLLFATLGIYYPVWFFRRRSGLNRLNSQRKLALWPLVLFSFYFALEVVVTVLAGEQTPAEAFGDEVVIGMALLQLTSGIVMLIQCFAIKRIIEDHAQSRQPAAEAGLFQPPVQLSGILTFFLSILYLQHAINTHVVNAEPAH